MITLFYTLLLGAVIVKNRTRDLKNSNEALKAEGVPVLDIKGTIIYGYDMKNTKYVLNALNLM